MSFDLVDDVSASSIDYCCIIDNQCYGPYEDFSGVGIDFDIGVEEALSLCEAQNGDFRVGEPCRQINQCVLGCCVFFDGSQWTQNYGVSEDACLGAYSNSFFDSEVTSSTQCEALFQTQQFRIFFNIKDNSGQPIEIDRSESFIQQIGEPTRCNFNFLGASDYNYGVDCDGTGRVGFGSYVVNVFAEIGGNILSYEGTIRVFGEEIFEIVLDTTDARINVVNITGQVFEYEEAADGSLVKSQREVSGATVTISGLNVQATSGGDGRFTLINVPVNDADPVTRTISVFATGYYPWAENVQIFSGLSFENEEIYLVKDVDAPTGKICCPNSLGCRDSESSGSCFAGAGRHGVFCDGLTPTDACNVAAPFCCPAAELCPENHRSSAGGCSAQGCNVPCLESIQCLQGNQESVKADFVCLCGEDYIDDGYCCDIGGPIVHSDEPCENYGMSIDVLVLSQSRSDGGYEPQPGATVFFMDDDDGSSISGRTNSEGILSLRLPEGTFRSNAYMSGFRTPQSVKRMSVEKVGENFNFRILQSLYLDSSNNLFDSVDILSNQLGPVDISGSPNLIYALDYAVDNCDWDNDEITFASASSIPGREAIYLEWDFEDCLELRNFRIERKVHRYTRSGNNIYTDVGDESAGWVPDSDNDNRFREVARVPAGTNSFVDNNVRWSTNYPIVDGLPALYDRGAGEIGVSDGNIQKMNVYEYRITPIFSTYTGTPYPSENDGIVATMGDAVCEGRSGITSQLCGYDSIQPSASSGYYLDEVLKSDSYLRSTMLRALRTLRLRCTNDNFLEFASSNENELSCYTQNTFTLAFYGGNLYSGPVCSGPNEAGQTFCSERDDCRGDPDPRLPDGRGAFGMLEPLLHMVREDEGNSCYGEPVGELFSRACVLQPDSTLSDRCVYCEEISDCSDYTSPESCRIDNCVVGNPDSQGNSCRWIETAMSGSGEGLCVPGTIRPSESYCELASRDNLPFQTNIGWDSEFCSNLGNCYSTFVGGCRDCSTVRECGNYDDEYECTGDPDNMQNISITYPKPEDFELGHDDSGWKAIQNTCIVSGDNDPFYNNSNDGCGLGTCRWLNEACVRDANSNIMADRAINQINLADNEYPILSPITDADFIFSRQEGRRSLSFISDKDLFYRFDDSMYDFANNKFGFRFCIDQTDTCCPNLPYDESDIQDFGFRLSSDGVTIENIVDSYSNFIDPYNDGIYYLRYISQDTNYNIAPLQSIEFVVDITDPNISISLRESLTSNPADDRVKLRFNVQSEGQSPRDDVDTEFIKCEFTLNNVIQTGVSEEGFHLQEGIFMDEHTVEYLVESGLYLFTAVCQDEAKNTVVERLHIRADGFDNLNLIHPPIAGAVEDSDFVPFEIHTEVPSSCRLDWPRLDGSDLRNVLDFDTQDGLIHTIPGPQISLPDLVGDGPVYHDIFGIYCIEEISHCTLNGIQCNSDADCGGRGHCQRREYRDPVTFVRDGVPPLTTLHPYGISNSGREDISYRKEIENIEISGHDYIMDGRYFYNRNVSIDFTCEGIAPDDNFPSLYAECKDVDPIYYCIDYLSSDQPGGENFCNENSPDWKSYDEFPNIMEQRSFSICYYSIDEVGNEEDIRCSTFYINRDPPVLDLSLDTEFVYGSSYVTGSDTNVFSARINAISLDNHQVHYRTSDDTGRVLVESSRQERKITPPSYQERSTSEGLFFSGDLPRLARVNSLGPNALQLVAEDRYGNVARKTIYIYYDLEPPLLRDYEINDESMALTTEYNQDIHFRFRLDDVFWTNEVTSVSANVYAHNVGPFASDFEMGWTDLNYVRTIISDENVTRTNLTEDVEDYIRNLFYHGDELTEDQKRDRLDDIAEWKEYEFYIDSDLYFNEDLRLNDIGVGEYILEIRAVDALGQEMVEHIMFNITDSREPSIQLEEPRIFRQSSSDLGDPRVRITNDVNQEFVVVTEQPSFCFFDLGYVPTQNNPMQEDVNREVHRYVMDDFEPFFDRFPITISCTSHGIDLHSERYSLIFDRRPLSLSITSSRGDLVPPSVNKDHIREFQLDFEQRRYGELKPLIRVEDISDERIIECNYYCSSPNSLCIEPSGTFPGSLSTNPSFSPRIREEYGDYMYTIICNDQAGNIARARDLVFSVRDRGAPQKLYIFDETYYPINNEEIYDEVVDFKISTTMLSFCSVIFTEGGIENILMSEDASLSHKISVNMTEHAGRSAGDFKFKFRCEQSTDRRNIRETDEMFFTMITEFDEISPDMFSQMVMSAEYVPVFRVDDLPSGVSHIEYSLIDDSLSESRIVPNTGSLVIPELKPDSSIFLRGIYSSGQLTPIIEVNVHENTLDLPAVDLESVRDGSRGQLVNPIKEDLSGLDVYALQGDRLFITMRPGDSVERIFTVANGQTRGSQLYAPSPNIIEDNYRIYGDGYHDFYFLIRLVSGELKELYIPVSRYEGAPVIESVTPRFLGRDRKLTVEVSRPSECSVSYPSASSDRQLTIRSEEASTRHEFVIDDLKVSGRRHEATHVTVYCNDFESEVAQKDHLVQIALTAPRILDISSDNSIFNGSSRDADYIFTSVRDEDVHIIVNTNEYSRCTYEDEIGEIHEFVDYFLPNLYPSTSLASNENGRMDYVIRCENEAGISANNQYRVSVFKNPDAPLYLHDAYPTDVTKNPYPKIEVYTFRDASCAVDIHEEAEDTNIFFRILGNIFRTSSRMESELVGHRYRHTVDVSTADMHRLMGLRIGQIYRATIQCQYDGDSTSKDISFIYSPDADPRPIIYIE